MIQIYAKPMNENDFYAIKFYNVIITPETLTKLLDEDAYLRFKFEKFKTQDTTKDGVESFKDRPSFRDVDKVEDLMGSIYTATIEDRNNLSYQELLEEITLAKETIPDSRRLLVRFSNPIDEYISSELDKNTTSDMTCLAFIHYLPKCVNITFRANDIKNEMFYDFVLIYWFFIRPIHKDKKVNILMTSSTSQNISSFDKVVNQIIGIIGL